MRTERRVPWLSLALSVAAVLPAAAQEPKKAPAKRQDPPPLPPGVVVDRDLEYARVGDRSLRLDLYRPEAPTESPRPLVVWVHGGGWRAGSKANCPAVFLTRRGYAVASVDYRLSGAATFPAQIEDCRAALRWLRAHASDYAIDPTRVGVWGSSAGGHLVALLGTSGDRTEWDGVGEHRDQSAAVQAVCDFFGPTDFTKMGGSHDRPNSPEALLIGGPVQDRKAEAAAANPITYVTKDDPPFFVVHGEDDKTVPIGQSELLTTALESAGVPVEFLRVAKAGHGFKADSDPPVRAINDRVAAFFDRHLKAGE